MDQRIEVGVCACSGLCVCGVTVKAGVGFVRCPSPSPLPTM